MRTKCCLLYWYSMRLFIKMIFIIIFYIISVSIFSFNSIFLFFRKFLLAAISLSQSNIIFLFLSIDKKRKSKIPENDKKKKWRDWILFHSVALCVSFERLLALSFFSKWTFLYFIFFSLKSFCYCFHFILIFALF